MERKLKVISSNNTTLVTVHSKKGEQLSVREADALSRDLIPWLFPVTITPKGKKFLLAFDVTGYMPLPSYLKSGLRKQHFAALLSDVFYTLRDLHERFFNVSAVILNHNYVFVNPITKKVRFVFVPIQFFSGGTSIREFYSGFAKNTLFSQQNENLEYVDELLTIVNRGINVSLFDLEEYIISISELGKSSSAKRRCKKCSAVNEKDVYYCATCGEQLEPNENRNWAVYDPLQSVSLNSNTEQAEMRFIADSISQSSNTAALMDEPINGLLIHRRTNQRIDINKPVFRIGKSEESDFAIEDNPQISRNHAEIRWRNGHFYIVDLFSTNKTFMNGVQIKTQKEVEILSGNIVSLGNEEFEFYNNE